MNIIHSTLKNIPRNLRAIRKNRIWTTLALVAIAFFVNQCRTYIGEVAYIKPSEKGDQSAIEKSETIEFCSSEAQGHLSPAFEGLILKLIREKKHFWKDADISLQIPNPIETGVGTQTCARITGTFTQGN
tara:strand:+ start:176 stop:565 length:390 start_codon:yes stop_codon:yes gene_type:complete